MDPWIAWGIFLLGAGIGALTTAALHVKQIRKLKVLLEAARKQSSNNRTRTTLRAERA